LGQARLQARICRKSSHLFPLIELTYSGIEGISAGTSLSYAGIFEGAQARPRSPGSGATYSRIEGMSSGIDEISERTLASFVETGVTSSGGGIGNGFSHWCGW